MRNLFAWEEISVRLLEVGAASSAAIQLLVNNDDTHIREVIPDMVREGLIVKPSVKYKKQGKTYVVKYYMLTEKGIQKIFQSEAAVEKYPELEELRDITFLKEGKEPWELKMFPFISADLFVHYLQTVLTYAVFRKAGVVTYPVISVTEGETNTLNTYISELQKQRFAEHREGFIRQQKPMFLDALQAKRKIVNAGDYDSNDIYTSVRRSSVRAYCETADDLYGVYVVGAWKKGWTNASLHDDETAYEIIMQDLSVYSQERNRSSAGSSKMPAIVLVPNVRDFIQALGQRDEDEALSEASQSGIRRLGDETGVMYVVPETRDCKEALLGVLPVKQASGSLLAGSDMLNMEKKRWEDDLIQEDYFIPRPDEYPDPLMRHPFSLITPDGTRLVHVSPVMTVRSIREMDAVINKYPGLIYEIICTGKPCIQIRWFTHGIFLIQ